MSFCQYDAYPTTWAEFVEAIATPETAVHLPENAVWDMNDYQPEGYNNTIFQIKCDRIEGNGTTIRNLKLTNSYFKSLSTASSSQGRIDEVSGLHFSNIVLSNDSGSQYFLNFQNRPTTIDGERVDYTQTILYGCTFSGVFSVNSTGNPFRMFGNNLRMVSCACNIEVIDSATSNKKLGLCWNAQYCNFKVATRGVAQIDTTNNSGDYGAYYSWLDLYGDDLTNISVTRKASASIFRCSAPITTVQKAAEGFPSIVSVPDPLTVVLPEDSNLIVCTDAQCRDANWLHNAGFPIAVDP